MIVYFLKLFGREGRAETVVRGLGECGGHF